MVLHPDDVNTSKPRRRWRRLRGLRLLCLAFVLSGSQCEIHDMDIQHYGSGYVVGFPGVEVEDMQVYLGTYASTRDIDPDDLADAVIDQIEVRIVSPEDADMAFARRVELYVVAPELDPVRVGYAEDFEPGQRSLSLITDDVDITEYVASEWVTIYAVVDGRSPPEPIELEGAANLHVGITMAGACNQM